MQQSVKTIGRRFVAGSVLAAGIAAASATTTIAPASAGVPASPERACNLDRIVGNGADKFNNTTLCQHFGPGWGYYVTVPPVRAEPPRR